MTDQQTAARREGAFRAWVNELGYVREKGWIGGVAAGIARRIGVDPIVVRGVFVVTTLAWFPALWVYTIAWAALPDEDGKSPFGTGRSAVGVLLAFALTIVVSVGQLFFLFYFFVVSYAENIVHQIGMNVTAPLMWVMFVVAVVVGLVRLARSGPRSADSIEPDPAPVATADADPAAFDVPPPNGADDMEAWRGQYAEWRRQHNEWRIQQGEDPVVVERELRRQQQEAFRAESARVRAARRAANPRTSLAFVGIAIGAALLVGGAIGAVVLGGYGAETAVTAGALAGSVVFAVAMVVAGILRRRSGFLALLTVTALVIGGSGVARSALDDFVLPGAQRFPGAEDLTIYQPFGFLTLSIESWKGGEGTTTVTKGSGDTFITVQPDVDVQMSLNLVEGDVILTAMDDDGRWRDRNLDRGVDGYYHWGIDVDDEKATRTIALAQSSGTVRIQLEGERP